MSTHVRADFSPSPEAALEASLQEIGQIREALASRDIIGQAKGMIRLLTHTHGEAAFTLLRRMSQDTNLKIRDIAALIAECAASGEPLPGDLARSWRRWVTPITASASRTA
jgi:hypothetical protein